MTGKHIALRALEPADIDLLYKWENDTSLWHLGNTQTPFSRFALEQYVMNSNYDIYAAKQLRLMIDCIEDNSKEKTIGAVDLFDFDPKNKRAGIGILITKSQRGKGYASEALKLMIDYSFNTLMLHQLFCNIQSNNTASLQLFLAFDFTIIGTKKEWLLNADKWDDEYMLQKIKTNI